MRLASSLLISVAIHTVIFSFPVSFLDRGAEPILVPVVLLGGNGDGEEGLAGKGGPGSDSEREAPAARRNPKAAQRANEQTISNSSRREDKTNGAGPSPLIIQEPLGTGTVTTEFKGDREAWGVSPGGAGRGDNGEGSGDGESYAGAGSDGSGRQGSPGGSGFGRVVYAYNPRPNYPEAARREGWEGTVILRVLVDQEGRSSSIEVSRSSGFDTLDRAAAEAVKSWRFYPASYRQRRVESWVRIPIVFSLAELKN